jgi:sporulation protein YlmC with PRC-barrel domain
MLRSMSDLEDCALRATDGTIGQVKDFYFDDESWVIRYLVVDAGKWLLSRKVLISPIAIGRPDWTERELPVSITKEQVKNSPDIDTDKPVSRQNEMQYLGYYGFPYYWGEGGLWGNGAYPSVLMTGDFAMPPLAAGQESEAAYSRAETQRHQDDDVHLRSCKAVMNYHIHATDGAIGHVQDMLVDEETWAIRYFIVHTSNWWLGHKVLIAPQWVKEVRWSDATLAIGLARQEVKNAPPYDPSLRLNREQEMRIHEHYGREAYWVGEEP